MTTDLCEAVLAALTSKWQTTRQIADKVPNTSVSQDMRNHLRRVQRALWRLQNQKTVEHWFDAITLQTGGWRLRP